MRSLSGAGLPYVDGGGDAASGAGDAGADGTGADGAAIANMELEFVDINGKSVTTKTDANGYYRISLRGMKAPLVATVKRDGKPWKSMLVQDIVRAPSNRKFYTINLTGLTDVVASEVAKKAGLNGADALTPATVAAQKTAVPDVIAAVNKSIATQLTAAGLDQAKFDPLVTPFIPDQKGYDKVLETTTITRDPDTGTSVFPLDVLTEIKALFEREDAMWATSIPEPAKLGSNADSCYLHDGQNTTELRAEAATDPQYPVGIAYRVGAKRNNDEILAIRNTTNADGSARREIDVRYTRKHTDGTSTVILHTLISGSSHGTCASPTNSSTLRFLGNQRLAFVAVRPQITESHSFNINTGAAISQTVNRSFHFRLIDYRKQFTYAVVTGPGPTTTVNGQTYPFSLKLLAPQVLRDDPAMVGRRGNSPDWRDDDTFRICRSATSTTPHAVLADCAVSGAQGNLFGTTWSKSTSPTGAEAADTTFASLGLGGEYTIALYNDDGWKSINGQAGKTPVASYKVTQKTLPFTLASLAIGNDSTGRMPSMDGLFGGNAYSNSILGVLNQTGGPGVQFVTTAFRGVNAPDGAVFVPLGYYHFTQGSLATNASNAFWPTSRTSAFTYFANTTPSGFNTLVPSKDSRVQGISYFEIGTEFYDRNGHKLIHLKTYTTP